MYMNSFSDKKTRITWFFISTSAIILFWIILSSLCNYLFVNLLYHDALSSISDNYSLGGILNNYFKWLLNVITRFDFGESSSRNLSVLEYIGYDFLTSFTLLLASVFIITVVFIPVSFYAVVKEKKAWIYISRVFLSFSTVPILLVVVLFRPFWSKLFGIEASYNESALMILSKYFIGGMFIVTFDGFAGEVLRHLEGVFQSVKNQKHLIAVRARNGNYTMHFLRSAAVPTINFLTSKINYILSASFIIEFSFFSRGLGKMSVDAINDKDINVIIGVSFIFSVIIMISMLFNKFITGYLDPRLR